MLFKNLFQSSILLHTLAGQAYGVPTAQDLNKRATIDDFIAKQNNISYAGVLANIGPAGSKAHGANAGSVLASPSKQNPDYFFTWTRDAAMVNKAIFEQFTQNGDANLRIALQDYISAQAKLQTVSNPSGGFSDGAGLGEAKFNADLTPFTGDWGRPQRDGPALRAIAMMLFGNWLIQNGQSSTASSVVWPVVKNDLAYVGQYWNQTGFDLWEEVRGSSFFTTAVQYRALIEGSAFGKKVGQTCSACDSQAPNVLCFMNRYWNGQYIISNINTDTKRSGKDINSVITTAQMFDPAVGCDDVTFQPCSPRALSNLKAVVDSFRSTYAINNGIPQNQAVALGRYSEDVYYNGNPWYLATLAAAEQLYFALYQYNRAGSITMTNLDLPFWRDIYPSAATGTYASSTSTYRALTSAMKSYADSFVAVVQKYTPAAGNLAEQFDRNTGAPLSAADLTWSYASFLTMTQARQNIVPASWGAASAKLPSTCSSSSVKGSYTASTNTNWPSFDCITASSVSVTFNVLHRTNFGEEVYVVGSIPALGSWDVNKAVKLAAQYYVDRAPLWSGTVALPAGQKVEYKYMRRLGSGSPVWESRDNRVWSVPQSCRSAASVSDGWSR